MLARIKPVFEYGIALGVLYFAWWYASVPMAMPKYLLPSPGDTLNALWTMALENKLQPHLYYTAQNIVLGLLIGSVVGIALAYLLYRLPRLSAILDGPLVVFQTAPKIALAPLFVVWFGLGLGSKLILIFSLVFFPVLLGALAGFRGIDSRMNDLSKLLELNIFERFFKIDFMAALPGIFVGLKIGAVQALVGAILAEWISGQQGLGFLMTLATATYKTPLLFGAVLLTSLFGIALHVGITAIEHFALSWKAQDDQ